MLYVHIFHATLGLDVSPYEVPPHIPEHRPPWMQTEHPHILMHTLQVFPSAPTSCPRRPTPPNWIKLKKIVIKIIEKLI